MILTPPPPRFPKNKPLEEETRRKEIKPYQLIKDLIEKRISENLSYLDFRNLCIKQMILKGDKTYAQIGAEFFPPLTATYIHAIGRQFGIRPLHGHKKWTKEEDAILREQYGKIPRRQLAARMYCTVNNLANRVAFLGLTKGVGYNHIEEKRKTIKNYKGELVIIGPPSEEEIRFLKTHENLTMKELHTSMNRSDIFIQKMKRKYGLTRIYPTGNKRTHWSPEDIKFLKTHIKMKSDEVGKQINKAPNAVSSMRSKLKISEHPGNRKVWSENELKIAQSKTLTQNQQLELLHISHRTLVSKQKELGVR